MIAMFVCALAGSPFQFNYQSGLGLTVSVDGIPLVASSGFQYFAPGWSKGYFSSDYNSENVDYSVPDQITATFAGYHGEATGKVSYRADGNTLHVTEDFQWSGKEPAEVELTGAKLWAPAFLNGSYQTGSGSSKAFGPSPSKDVLLANRTISSFFGTGNSLVKTTFDAPWGTFSIVPTSANEGSGWLLFDGRNYPQGWAKGQSLFWFGNLGLPISPSNPIHISFDLKIKYNGPSAVDQSQNSGIVPAQGTTLGKIPNVENTVNQNLPLVPYPKEVALKGDPGLEITGKWKFPGGQFFHWSEFTKTLARRFILSKPKVGARTIAVDGGSADIDAPHQGYQITILKNHVTVLGRDEAGLRFGLYRLANLVYSQNGHLYLPYGVITDWPSTKWRGFHLFSGPKALEFQKPLFDRVLGPMFFNQAVIECERTQWNSTPNQRGPEFMTKTALKNLFAMYRKRGIDPIPLIESFGHMDWAFKDGANLDIAQNPQTPYSVDPRKPGTKIFLDNLWNEAIGLLNPKVVHFGCDEVAMRGWPNDGALLTQLWPLQMNILGDIAQKNHVGMMLWGDECLAPTEAPDATNAPSIRQAAARREAIPPDTIVTDWHYKNDANLSDFEPTLDTWKNVGLTPIAATWYSPKNIQGFTSAAVQEKVGTLQTTWSGYFSDKTNPLTDFDQFAAFILSGEYSWSGRQDPPSQFGYDYKRYFWRLFYERPIPLTPIGGETLMLSSAEKLVQDGRFSFARWNHCLFYSAIDPSRTGQPEARQFNVSARGNWLILDGDTLSTANNGEKIAAVTVTYADGTSHVFNIRYDWNIRASSDPGVAPLAEHGQAYAMYFKINPKMLIKGITIREINPTSGLAIYGMSVEN